MRLWRPRVGSNARSDRGIHTRRTRPRLQTRRVGVALGLAFALATRASVAQGQTPTSPGELTLARSEFDAGIHDANDEHWQSALDHFLRAHAILRVPEILVNIASAQVRTGRWVAGAETYRRYLRERPDAPLTYRTAAESALSAIQPRIPHVRIVASGVVEGDSITLDGQPTSLGVVGGSLPVDPGHHELAVRREGRVVASTQFDLAEAEAHDVAITAPARISLRLDANSQRRNGLLTSPWTWTVVAIVVVGAAIGLTAWAESSGPYIGNANAFTGGQPVVAP